MQLPLVPVEALCVDFFEPLGLDILGVDGRGRALVRMPVTGSVAPLEDVVRARLLQETKARSHRRSESLAETLRAYLAGHGLERHGVFLMDDDGKMLPVFEALSERRAVELRQALGDGRPSS